MSITSYQAQAIFSKHFIVDGGKNILCGVSHLTLLAVQSPVLRKLIKAILARVGMQNFGSSPKPAQQVVHL